MEAPLGKAARGRGCRALASGVLAAALLLTACSGGEGGGEDERARTDTTCDGRIDGTAHVTVWFHAGPSAEYATLRRQVHDFNKAQRQVRVEVVTLPEQRPYNELVLSAAAGGDLPDLLDFDGPRLYSYAWSGTVKPIDSCLPDSLREDLLPSILRQGTYAGRLYGIGTFDSGLGLYVRPSVLRKAGIRVPHGIEDAWTAGGFTRILRTHRAVRARGTGRGHDRRSAAADTGAGRPRRRRHPAQAGPGQTVRARRIPGRGPGR
jgi:multiple sugar transport system substrate-binding protein